ncbi:hypothetical protein QYE76_031444 [Lolium multiflorum]|uniref:Uncharacterized protein n=1 Tax=Lolium multiflorum TaxID=4521 RepID=A0AAD8QRT4_LOLMU|nr:hypothetical protein QYE76_031444 [Lolium multiflorum]
MSRVSLQDSINPKPQSEGIAEEHPHQLAPSVGTLLAQDPSSADPIMSSAASSTPSSSSPIMGSPIRFGSYEFTPHSDSSRSTFSDLQGNMEMTFGSVHYNVNAEGILRLLEPPTSPEQQQLEAEARRSSQTIAIDWSSPEPRRGTRVFYTLDNLASTPSHDRRRPSAPSDPLPRRRSTPSSPVDDDDARPSIVRLIQRSRRYRFGVYHSLTRGTSCQAARCVMEPYVQTETYDLENGGSLVFERDLYLVSEKLERPPPRFHGVRIHNTPAGEQQWMITADLKGSSEPPISERILFSFKAYSWVDGLAHALQEGLARVCGQNIAALRGSRFAHFARHDTMGEPMALSSHPVLKIHVQHLDFMLHETRKDLELTRVHSHRAQRALSHHADAIRLLAKDRRSLRLQRAKNVATITHLREKIRTLEVTVRTQQDQIQEMEEDGEDIQGGDDFLSDDNDFEDDEFTDEEDYEFLEAAEDGILPIDVDEDNEE